MASWLQSQLKAAEGLLEAVDQATNKLVGGRDPNEKIEDAQPGGGYGTDFIGGRASGGRHVSSQRAQEVFHVGVRAETSVPAAPLESAEAPSPGTFQSARSLTTTPSASGQRVPVGLTFPGRGTQHQSGSPEARLGKTGLELGAEPVDTPPMLLEASPKHTKHVESAHGVHYGDTPGHGTSLPLFDSPNSGGSSERSIQRAITDIELDEAKETVNSMPPSDTGSREFRLVQVVQQLRKRLEDLKSENKQLEELLHQSDSLVKRRTAEKEDLEDRLAAIQKKQSASEATYQAQVLAQDLELAKLRTDLASSKKWCSELESQVSALQGTNLKLLEDQRVTEGRMMEALKEQLLDAEQQLEQERSAHSQVVKASTDREHELQQEMAQSAAVLSRMQRQLDERNSRIVELEGHIMSLQGDVQQLTSHVQQQGDGFASGQEQQLAELQGQVDCLTAELASARAATEAATAERAAAHAEVKELSSEIALLRERVGSSGAQASGSSEQRLREVSELLYLKQTQLEKLAADKAAQQIAYEHQIAAVQRQMESVRRKEYSEGRCSTSGADLIIPMDSLGDSYDCLTNQKSVGQAIRTGARLLDSTTSRFIHVIKHYPLWRLGLFLYLVFIHVYCYLLISRLQHHAVASMEAPHDAADHVFETNENPTGAM